MSGGAMAQAGARPRVGAIWAQDRDGVIGADGRMLWRVPADFRHFRAATLGCAVVMGRTTWESIGGALDGRASIVLTRRADWEADGAIVVRDLRAGLAAAAAAVDALGQDPREGGYRALPRVWMIGGGSVYTQALEAGLVDELLVSVIDLDAGARATEAGTEPRLLVRAPRFDPSEWQPNGPCADPPGQWRPVSGDAAWRVDHYRS
ncbi:dihydrofolate reductase [Actinomyces ruminicola]|uniref:dihydrofolate reductase n=2 Tax=Actinomyces ruminicola TaxID=332524 RepID=A0A1G9XPK8_9ACTO|nr:dihydrofolate reductase [Actinomyces ruminicola]SDN89612.1 dihydrofolate reductase [Actinomyces ruminicola]